MFGESLLLMAMKYMPGTKATSHPPKKTTSSITHPIVQKRAVGQVALVQIDGKLNVTLQTGCAKARLTLRGDARDLPFVTSMTKGRLLQIVVKDTHPQYGALYADLCMPTLTLFAYHGAGVIVGKNIQSSQLKICITNEGQTTLTGSMGLRYLQLDGKGYARINGIHSQNLRMKIGGKARVDLIGVANLAKLDVDNQGWISLYWVRSADLLVLGHGSGFMQLAGVADRLQVELWDKSHFNGRYLRGFSVYAKTHDHSVAEVATVSDQHAVANDASDIRFYNLPKINADFMAANGSVLDMRDLNAPDVQEYTEYNR